MGIVLAAFAASVLASCGCSDTETARGLIQEVQSESLLELKSLTLRTRSGETLEFAANGKTFAGFSPSHLREHMVLGDPVTITFHREGETLVIDDVTD